ncbi:MAG: hypothetical protein FJ104_16330 [Deltaproteobacteria bacterium]|nr:hypothetical protein [Deltaproteobacteria bacterium]
MNGLSAFLLVVAIVGLLFARNTLGEGPGLVERAGEVACGLRVCTAELRWHVKRPLHQRLQFDVGRGRPAEVECRRSAWLVGDYACFAVHVDDRGY